MPRPLYLPKTLPQLEEVGWSLSVGDALTQHQLRYHRQVVYRGRSQSPKWWGQCAGCYRAMAMCFS